MMSVVFEPLSLKNLFQKYIFLRTSFYICSVLYRYPLMIKSSFLQTFFLKDDQIKPVPMLKRQVFVLRVLGLLADDGAVIVHAELNTTVRSVIQMVRLFKFIKIFKILLKFY